MMHCTLLARSKVLLILLYKEQIIEDIVLVKCKQINTKEAIMHPLVMVTTVKNS